MHRIAQVDWDLTAACHLNMGTTLLLFGCVEAESSWLASGRLQGGSKVAAAQQLDSLALMQFADIATVTPCSCQHSRPATVESCWDESVWHVVHGWIVLALLGSIVPGLH